MQVNTVTLRCHWLPLQAKEHPARSKITVRRRNLFTEVSSIRSASQNQHRARRLTCDLFGGAAQQHVLQAGVTMARDDDQIGMKISGVVLRFPKSPPFGYCKDD
jgi:hypothetical protein